MKNEDGDYVDSDTCCVFPKETKHCDSGPAVSISYIYVYVPEHFNHKFSVGEMWVSNDEYQNQVNFCPFCGKKAPKGI